MYILVQLFSWNQIEKRLYYAVNNWRCIEVRIKKKFINSCQQFSWARMWDCTATSYGKNRWRDKTDIVRYRGGKLLVHACLLMGTTPKYDFMVQTLVSTSNLLSVSSGTLIDSSAKKTRIERIRSLKNMFIFEGTISRSGLRHVDMIASGKLQCLKHICNLDKLRSLVHMIPIQLLSQSWNRF